jgi:hypothetical protein
VADYDLSDILGATDDDIAKQKTAATVAALRGQKGFGWLMQGLGLEPGSSIAQNAEQREAQLGKVPLERQQMALTGAKIDQDKLQMQKIREAMARAGDPNSIESQVQRGVATKFGKSFPGLAIPDNASAADLEPAQKLLAEGYNADENRAARLEAARLRQAMMGGGAGGLKPKDADKEFGDLAKALDTNRARGSLLKENQARLNNAERLETLVLGPNGRIENLTPQMVREASTSLANLISSGAAPLAQIEEMTPHTLAGQFAELKQKILNEPQGADAQKFLQKMLETAGREKKVTLKQIRAAQAQALPQFANLAKVNQTKYASILKGAGLNPDDFDENGLLRAPPEESAVVKPHPQDSAAVTWAKAHPSDPRAAKILQLAGAE